MREPLLVLNAGSSSIKFSVFETGPDRSPAVAFDGQVERIETEPRFAVADAAGRLLAAPAVDGPGHDRAIRAILRWFERQVGSEGSLAGAGHRIVHGGDIDAAALPIDTALLGRLEALVPLAPLHQPHNLAAIRAVAAAAPGLRQVACFDTAFHRHQPALARRVALPRALDAKGIRRYGFHGLSYEYIAGTLPRLAPGPAQGRVVVAHLGNGASLCALRDGVSIANTMGFTTLDGLVMGTRPGLLDAGVVLYLMQHEGLDLKAVEDLLYHRSGLLGLSGLSGDMRELLASGQDSAREAVDLFVYRVGRELGSLAAALGGLDALVFTGGIGEHAGPIRARICRDAAWLGVALDEAANEAGGPCLSPPGAAVSAWVIPTDENLMIARHTRRVLDQPQV